jgi:hypothetical protein
MGAVLHLVLLLWAAAPPAAGTVAPSAAGTVTAVVGEVLALPAGQAGRLTVRKDGGGEVAVEFAPTTVCLRTRPGATSLEGATTVPAGEIAVRDRVLVQGTPSDDGATIRARRIVVMARSDIDARRETERQDWRRRGIAGVVTSVDPRAREVVVRPGRAAGMQTLVVTTAGRPVAFLRYAPGSVRFADARPGTFDDVKPGDQVRVLGDRSADGTRVAAETVVSGTFRVVRGTAAAVDAQRGTLTVDTGARGASRVSVVVAPDTLVRRLPPPMVARLLSGAAPDPDEALDRLPPASLDGLQKGVEIAALGPKEGDPGVLPAIKLVTWVLPQGGAGNFGGRGRRGSGESQADPFVDLLDLGGEGAW